MADGKEYWSEEEREEDIARFQKAIRHVSDQLDRLSEACVEDDILRDTVIATLSGYARQLAAIERACLRSRDRDAPEDGP